MKLIIFVFSLFAALPLTVSAQVFTLSDDTFEVAVNSPSSKSKTITATAAAGTTFPADAKIEWKGLDGFISVSAPTRTSDTIITHTFTAIKAVTNKMITASFGGRTSNVFVTVKPELSKNTVSFVEKTTGVSITLNGSQRFTIRLNPVVEAPPNALTVTSEPVGFVTAALIGLNLKVNAAAQGTTKVKLLAYGDTIREFDVVVTARIDIDALPEEITVLREEPKPIELKDRLPVDLTKLVISQPENQSIAVINDKNQLVGLSPGKTEFGVAVKDAPDQKKSIKVEVKPKAENIVLEGFNTGKSLVKGQPWQIKAKLMGEGVPIPGATITATSNDPACVSVTNLPDNTFAINAEGSPCDSATLTVTATVNGKTLTQKFSITPKIVTGFAPLKIRLDMLDRQTARDLFGRKAYDEYFIAKVRLFNTIGREDENIGNSILVYSESLEVKVGVEWREKDGDPANADWKTLDTETARAWFPDAQLTNDTDWGKKCRTIKQKHMFVPYRPLTFDMVLNTQERRDSRSTRSRIFLMLNGFSTLSSVVTSIAVPGSSSDIPLGLDKFRNLLIPGMEKLFPSLNEVQRQNITSMVMRPLEEVPYGSDITRLLFFPKRAIEGVMINRPDGGARKTQLKISAISSSDACAEVGIIQKITTPTASPVNRIP